MASRALPIEVTNILEKLEFIARIPSNHKANIPDKTLQHKDSWWGAFARGRKNVNRKSTMRDIQTIIDDTSQVLKTFNNEEEYVKLIINALKRAKQPIQEMGESTYGDDVSVGSEISVKLRTIDIYLDKYKQYLDPLPSHSGYKNNYRLCNTSPTLVQTISNSEIVRFSDETHDNIVADLKFSSDDKLDLSDDN